MSLNAMHTCQGTVLWLHMNAAVHTSSDLTVALLQQLEGAKASLWMPVCILGKVVGWYHRHVQSAAHLKLPCAVQTNP